MEYNLLSLLDAETFDKLKKHALKKGVSIGVLLKQFIDHGVLSDFVKAVHVSKNYGQFKVLTGNRFVDPQRVERIKKSIQAHGYITNPIITNEKLEVIDGQGRLEALKQLEMPVEYLIHAGAGIEQCIAMNIYQKNWSSMDYIKSYADQGRIEYKKLLRFLIRYGELPKTAVISACKGDLTEVSPKQIASGDFVCANEETIEAELSYLKLVNAIDFNRMTDSKVRLFAAIRYCIRRKDISPTRLLEQLEKNAYKMVQRSSISDFLAFIEEVYNHRIPIKNRVSLVFEYKKKLSETKRQKENERLNGGRK